jgi:GT2 family glycosyltransferase/glycosyltransferase involved in cell wall biosynthesis
LTPKIKLAFLSGTEDLNRRLIEHVRALYPELPLWVVADFPPADHTLKWIRYRVNRPFADNLRTCREELRGHTIRLAGVMLVPNVPFRRMRLLALVLSPRAFLAFNENLNHFMLRPGSLPAIARHLAWRVANALRWSARAARKADWGLLAQYAAAMVAGILRPKWRPPGGTANPAEMVGRTPRSARDALVPQPEQRDRHLVRREQADGGVGRGPGGPPHRLQEFAGASPGVTVVIPSRTGKELLQAQLPGLLAQGPEQIIVVDNGSTDGTVEWLACDYPQIEVVHSAAPLSFARAVNLGIARARCPHVCLLNNDMRLEPGFFAALERAFEQVPDLFSATAQIQFPPGVRREETGKTVFAQSAPADFPVRCDVPLPGEDGSYVLYGSGGCSLYDTAKLRALGNVDEVYDPAYVEDLDLGYRAWQRGWPSVYVAGAIVEHRHRATTTRFFTEEQLGYILEINYLRFVARAVSEPKVFRRLWTQAIGRLFLCQGPLGPAAAIALRGGPAAPADYSEDLFLALTDGNVSVFPGRHANGKPGGKPRVMVASPYLPFPLSHGGAVRMYNLMRRAAEEFDLLLVAFTERAAPPPPEVLDLCAEVVLVRRAGSHDLPCTGRPEVVEEFASPAFRAALQQTVRKWHPAIAQLEFTQLAQYAGDCAPARTILVEHDVTFDLCQQLLGLDDRWELRRELDLWRKFETAAWRTVDRVVTMSERDRRMVTTASAVTLANGVDLDRFRPAADSAAAVSATEPRRILFIGSFAHRPNVMAVEFFVNDVWPLLHDATLHIIAGARHEQYAVLSDLAQPGIVVEGFVADVRPAYRRAALVVAPLVASAGTNIKVLEAMAMGKTVVSTPAGVNGLDLIPGQDFVLVHTAREMAAAIENMLAAPAERARVETAARARVERDYGWDAVARSQSALYRELLAGR